MNIRAAAGWIWGILQAVFLVGVLVLVIYMVWRLAGFRAGSWMARRGR